MYRKLIAMIFCLSTPLLASAGISNVIVFGDSYSDMGNFPEDAHTLTDPNKPMTLANLTSMVFVPVVNPVDLSLPNVNVHNYPVPNLANDHLPPLAYARWNCAPFFPAYLGQNF